MAGFGGGEAGGGVEGVEGDDAGVEEQTEFEWRGGFEQTHCMGAAVGGFGAGWEGV